MDSIHIIKAENAGNLTVCLTFSDNSKQTIDVGSFIRRHPRKRKYCMGKKLGLNLSY